MVSHLAREPLPTTQLPRKFTVFISAPPGDGLRSAREYFQEYVKPVLVAAAVEWDVIEGRREGEVRAGMAARVRNVRRKHGERPPGGTQDEEADDMEAAIRDKNSIRPSEDLEGDLIIGRHTWKEYIRGLQEGWLGPLDPPSEVNSAPTSGVSVLSEMATEEVTPHTNADPNPSSEGAEAATGNTPSQNPTQAIDSTPKRAVQNQPFITPLQYSDALLAPTTPKTLAPAVPLPFPHILGFLNTPTRTYRFLTRRYLADNVGGIVAGMVLAKTTRPWEKTSEYPSSIDPTSPISERNNSEISVNSGTGAIATTGTRWEQQVAYVDEEKEWHKSARAPNPAGQENKERVWLEDMVIDERIGERMTTFVNSMKDDVMARKIADKQTAQLADAAEKPGWLDRVKIWTGWSDDDAGRVKGWEHGFVGNESE